jgi:hypothetical protein
MNAPKYPKRIPKNVKCFMCKEFIGQNADAHMVAEILEDGSEGPDLWIHKACLERLRRRKLDALSRGE